MADLEPFIVGSTILKAKQKHYELRAQFCLFTKLRYLNQISLNCLEENKKRVGGTCLRTHKPTSVPGYWSFFFLNIIFVIKT